MKNIASLSNFSIAGWWVCGSSDKASTIACTIKQLTSIIFHWYVAY
jgi:hypothetical protein